MNKHLKHLSDWLREEEIKGQSSEDEDIRNAKQEVTEVCIVFHSPAVHSTNRKNNISVLPSLTALISSNLIILQYC